MSHARYSIVLLLLACSVPPPGTGVNPENRSLSATVHASRSDVLAALSASAIELGMSVADANAGAGFWRSTPVHVANTGFAGALVGSTGIDVELTANLQDVRPDSVLFQVSGTFGYTDAQNRFARERHPITRDARAAWAYIDSLTVKAKRRLGS
jgi:hypothetical protein